MVDFFTWHDVEKRFEECKNLWHKGWSRIQAYNDEVIIYEYAFQHNDEEYNQALKKIFAKNYDINAQKINVDFTGNKLDVYYETEEASNNRKFSPLFKEMCLKADKEKIEKKLACQVMVLHSYKGGVGRTLSLVALLKAISSKYPNKKVLLIDADVEAPGLTWMAQESGIAEMGYLDLLSIMKYETINEDMIEKISSKVKENHISVLTEMSDVEHYFLPAYHKVSQILDIAATSDSIIRSQENRYIISETIAEIGKKIGADLVLIDLRAGITEFSAPYLFDERVGKIFVSSTSMQSVRGINQVMEQVFKKTEIGVENSKILLTSIPSVMNEDKILTIEDELTKNIDSEIERENSTFLKSDFIYRIPFDERLIHIEDFNSLCETLKGREITEKMELISGDIFAEERNEIELNEQFVRETLKKIYELSDSEITAEGNSSANMLITNSIKELARGFKNNVPRIVIPGAKGSGKTYIYKQLLAAKTWKRFENQANGIDDEEDGEAVIVPLISSVNNANFRSLIQDTIQFANEKFEDINLDKRFVSSNFLSIKNASENPSIDKQSEWNLIWEKLILAAFGNKYADLQAIDNYLEQIQKKVIFIIDGLEDLFMNIEHSGNKSYKMAFRAVCQDLINALNDLEYGNIGIIVFARKDMISEAIETNTEQFLSQYRKFELNWTQIEALRLALWLSAKAYPKLTENIQVTSAAKEVIIDRLKMMWGYKLGKNDSHEAYSHLWVIAALSDFTGQLQARDIVRFLKYATKTYNSVSLSSYPDRLIVPSEIRNAIGPCSKDKIADIKNEMKTTYSILCKFGEMDDADKKLPIALDKIVLSGEEIAKLEEEGYLKVYDKKYYLPEIIRRDLEFNYQKGARPKVLSFLVQQ